MAIVKQIVVVGDKGVLSEPIRLYDRQLGVEIPKQFVLVLNEAEDNDSGVEQLKLGNYSLGLIGSHEKSYLIDKLAGFNRVSGDKTFIVAQVYEEALPLKAVLKIKPS